MSTSKPLQVRVNDELTLDAGNMGESPGTTWFRVPHPPAETTLFHQVRTTLPRGLNKKQIIRLLKERWRTERAYEDLKGELGLDHFEGRSFPGWHHHISVVLCCYAFIVAERARHVPPSRRRSRQTDAQSVAA